MRSRSASAGRRRAGGRPRRGWRPRPVGPGRHARCVRRPLRERRALVNPPVSASVGIQIMAVLVVGALWLLLWQVTMAKRRDAARAEPSSPEPSASDQDPDALVAVTANGWGFTTDGDEVHLVPPAGLVGATGLWEGVGPGLPTGAAPEAGHDSGERLPAAVRTGEHLAPGDLGAAQLLPGDAAGLT